MLRERDSWWRKPPSAPGASYRGTLMGNFANGSSVYGGSSGPAGGKNSAEIIFRWLPAYLVRRRPGDSCDAGRPSLTRLAGPCRTGRLNACYERFPRHEREPSLPSANGRPPGPRAPGLSFLVQTAGRNRSIPPGRRTGQPVDQPAGPAGDDGRGATIAAPAPSRAGGTGSMLSHRKKILVSNRVLLLVALPPRRPRICARVHGRRD